MSEAAGFDELMRRVRAGDEFAAADLVRRYEPAVRRVVRFRLNPRLRRLCDSLDICQAVLGKFFARAALGQIELDGPEQLTRLLSVMARNELLKELRRRTAARRDQRREEPAPPEEAPARGPTPSQEAVAADLLREVRRRLTPEEAHLAELRGQGHGWPAIAEATGSQPDAVRKKLTRAVARVMAELGLEGPGDD